MNITGNFTEDTLKNIWKVNQENKKLKKENQRLNNISNETVEYLKYQLSCLDFEKDIKARMLCSMTIVMLEQKELKESDK